MKPYAVLLADDDAMVREGFKALLRHERNIGPIWEAGNGEHVMICLQACPVDILLLDIRMPDTHIARLARRVRIEYPAVRVIVVSGLFGSEVMKTLTDIGIHGFVQKLKGFDEVRKAIYFVVRGRDFFPDNISGLEMAGDIGMPYMDLTRKEIELLRELVTGATTKVIAEKLNLATSSVESRRHRLFKKTGSNNVAGLIAFGFRNGLL